MTAKEVVEFIDSHAKNLLIPRDGHAALMQILAAARQQIEADEQKREGPG